MQILQKVVQIVIMGKKQKTLILFQISCLINLIYEIQNIF